jgi:hypothetical protein
MNNLALILSIISLILSYLAFKRKDEIKTIELPKHKSSAILFKPKTPEQKRFEKKLKKGDDINIDELC